MKNLIKVHGDYGVEVEIDLDDLEVVSGYEAELYFPVIYEAAKRYAKNDVHKPIHKNAEYLLLDVIKDLNRRVLALEAALTTPTSKSKEGAE
jgi:hypothetical protein